MSGENLAGQSINEGVQVWVAGFGFDGTSIQGVWSRLFQSDFPNDIRVNKVFILPNINEEIREAARSMVPPSYFDQTFLIFDPGQKWRTLLRPTEQPGFAAIIERNRIPLLMTGPPTEDAWEEFQREWKLRT